MVDEAQDQNPVGHELARRSVRPGGRFIAIGDPNQAIYRFRGADTQALARVAEEPGATRYGLTRTRRCGKAIVAACQGLVPTFTATDDAPDGLVERCDREAMLAGARRGDFIVSRKNAPLAGAWIGLLRRGVPAMIAGRDMGKAMVALVTKLAGRGHLGLGAFMVKLDKYEAREASRIKAQAPRDLDERLATLGDTCQFLRDIAEGMAGVGELVARLNEVFVDVEPGDKSRGHLVLLSSVHRIKGAETNTVWVLHDTFYAGGDAHEERCLEYVACSRAKLRLVFVNPKRTPANPAGDDKENA